jgi:hypothetical protein
LRGDLRWQVGLVGYLQRQTSNRTGPALTPAEEQSRYEVNALGIASNLSFPQRKAMLGVKYYEEFANRSTFQGASLQITASLTF